MPQSHKYPQLLKDPRQKQRSSWMEMLSTDNPPQRKLLDLGASQLRTLIPKASHPTNDEEIMDPQPMQATGAASDIVKPSDDVETPEGRQVASSQSEDENILESSDEETEAPDLERVREILRCYIHRT